MKRLTIIYLIVLILMTGCSKSLTPRREEILELTDAWLSNRGLTSIENQYFSWSLDGTWIVEIDEDNYSITFNHSFTNESALFYQQEMKDYKIFFLKWSPDSSKLLAYGGSGYRERCSENRLLVFSLDDERQFVEVTQYEFSEDQKSCGQANWSPGGTKIADTINLNEIYIFDNQANFSTAIQPKLSENASIYGLWWLDEERLIYRIFEVDDEGRRQYEYRLIDLSNGPSDEFLFIMGTQSNFIGTNPSGQKLMFYEKENWDDNFFFVEIIDLETNNVNDSIKINGLLVNSYSRMSLDHRYICLWISNFTDSSGNILGNGLWIYDWETGKSAIVSDVEELIGWNDEEKAFTILRETSDGTLMLEMLYP